MSIQLFLKDSHKHTAIAGATLFLKDADTIEQTFKIVELNQSPHSMRAANIIEKAAQQDPSFIIPNLQRIQTILETTPIDGVRRSFLRIFTHFKIQNIPHMHDFLLDYCFARLNDQQEGIAPRVYAIYILHDFVQVYPDIKNELIQTLEFIMPEGTPALRSVAKHILKKLYKSARN